jgi:hypothetical protein
MPLLSMRHLLDEAATGGYESLSLAEMRRRYEAEAARVPA